MGIFDDGLGGFISSFLGSKNKSSAGNQTGAPEVDPNAYEYGGQPGGAAAHAGAYGATSGAAQLRTGPQANYDQANWDRQNSGQARVGQQQIADQISMRARGQSPQIATMMANRQRNQAMAAQGALASSARGPAALALANQTAANNTANAFGDISGQEQINAANEQRADEAGALGAYGSIRGGDLASQQQAAQQAQYQAQLEAQQRALNDQRSLGYSQLENTVNTTQLQAQAQRQSQEASNKLNAAQINSGIAAQNAGTNQQNGYGAIGLTTNVATGVATGGGGGGTPPPKIGTAARGGPVPSGHPYLVGEQGPELVIPHRADGGSVESSAPRTWGTDEPYLVGADGPEIRTFPHDGTVIPAPETAAILAPPRTWGNATASPQDVADIELGNEQNANVARQARLMAQEESPWERTVRRNRALKQAAPYLVTPEENEDARRSRAVLRNAKNAEGKTEPEDKPEEKAAVANGQAVPPSPSRLSSILGTVGKTTNDMASKVNPTYHAPTLMSPGTIQIGTRAMGGPVIGSPSVPPFLLKPASMAPQSSGMVDIGSGGSGMSQGQVLAASTGRTGNAMMPVGGGGVVGGTNVPGFTAREEGGPVGPSYESRADRQEMKARELRFRQGVGPVGPPAEKPGPRRSDIVTSGANDPRKDEEENNAANQYVGAAHLLANPIAGLLGALGNYAGRRSGR